MVGDDKKVTITWDRGEEDNETKGLSNEAVLDLNLLSFVQIVREEKMAHGSLASKEKNKWTARSERLETQVAALKEKRKGLTKIEQQPVTKKIHELLKRRLAYKDQALGRPAARGG